MTNQSWQFGEDHEYLSQDFARCQRPDGSFYGTGGVCRKGAPVGAKEKAESKDGAAAAIQAGAAYSDLKNGGMAVESDEFIKANGDPVAKVGKAKAKAEMMENVKFGLTQETMEGAVESGFMTQKQFDTIKPLFDGEGSMRVVQTSPPVQDGQGGWKMGVNGANVRLNKLYGGNWSVTMD